MNNPCFKSLHDMKRCFPQLSEQALSLVNVRAKAKRGRIFRAFQGVCGCKWMHLNACGWHLCFAKTDTWLICHADRIRHHSLPTTS